MVEPWKWGTAKTVSQTSQQLTGGSPTLVTTRCHQRTHAHHCLEHIGEPPLTGATASDWVWGHPAGLAQLCLLQLPGTRPHCTAEGYLARTPLLHHPPPAGDMPSRVTYPSRTIARLDHPVVSVGPP